MKNLILFLSIILVISCKEGPKEIENNLEPNEQNLKKSVETNTDILSYTHQIIPGKRLGAIILNENISVALDSLGKPDVIDAAKGRAVSTWQEYNNKPLTIYTTKVIEVENFSRIKTIRSLSDKYRTEENLGVKSSLDELKKYYELESVGTFTYKGKDYNLFSSPKGIAFEIGANQMCNGVLIYTSDIDPKSFYLPIYPTFKMR